MILKNFASFLTLKPQFWQHFRRKMGQDGGDQNGGKKKKKKLM